MREVPGVGKKGSELLLGILWGNNKGGMAALGRGDGGCGQGQGEGWGIVVEGLVLWRIETRSYTGRGAFFFSTSQAEAE